MININLNASISKNEIYNLIRIFDKSSQIRFDDKDHLSHAMVIMVDNTRVTLNTDGLEKMASSVDVCELPYFYDEYTVRLKLAIRHTLYKLLREYFNRESNYGILTGTRPVKLVRTTLERGFSHQEIEDVLKQTYLMAEGTIKRLLSICAVENSLLKKDPSSISLYIGIPYCPSRCHYCSFISEVCKDEIILDRYLDILIEELAAKADILVSNQLSVKSVYVGGGTPTVLTARQLDRLFKAIRQHYDLPQNMEYTVEAGRPDTINAFKLQTLKDNGINRISINPQSMNDETLKGIGREHSVKDIVRAFREARSAGFRTINMDLINGLPGEDIDSAMNNLAYIRELKPENVTIHNLSIKRGSDYYNKNYVNLIDANSTDESNEFYRFSLEEMGMRPYYLYRQKNITGNGDNCGYAYPGHECLYNMNIIEEIQTIIGFGAGSVTKIVDLENDRIHRIPNNRDIQTYKGKINENYLITKQTIEQIGGRHG